MSVETRPAQPTRPRLSGAVAVSLSTVVGVSALLTVAPRSGVPVRFVGNGPRAWLPLAALVVVGSLMGGVWALRSHHRRAGLGLAVAMAGSLLPLWAAWSWLPDRVRAGALAATPIAVAGVAQLALRWSDERPPSRASRVASALVATAVLVHLVGYNPFADQGCARTCADVWVPLDRVVSTRLVVGMACALTILAAIVFIAVVGAARDPTTPRAVVAATLVTLGGLAATSAVRWGAWSDAATTSVLLLIEPALVAVAAAAVCAVAARTMRTRAAVSQMVARLSGSEPALHDVGGGILAVHFAVPDDGRWVDRQGHDVTDVPTGSKHVVLSHEARPVLRLVLPRTADEGAVLAGLTPASRLVLRNAQLSAVANARLADVHASQRRVVTAADAERRRIERDLHDGAQQRLVSVAFHLKVALSGADPLAPAPLLRAEHRIREALGRLRGLAHGMFPGVLIEEGLDVALNELVATSDVPATLDIRLPDPVGAETAMAAYHAVVAALGQVGHATPETHAHISVVQDHDTLTVRALVHAGGAPVAGTDLTEAADRVGAMGGRFTASDPGDGGLEMTAVIPCVS